MTLLRMPGSHQSDWPKHSERPLSVIYRIACQVDFTLRVAIRYILNQCQQLYNSIERLRI